MNGIDIHLDIKCQNLGFAPFPCPGPITVIQLDLRS